VELTASKIKVFLKWAARANEHAKEEEEKEKNTTFSANRFHGALLKCNRD